MKLASVTVRNFRSFVSQDKSSTKPLSLGDGMNVIVGPNNCGKSNLLRAVSLALEDSGGEHFDPSHDIPCQLSWAFPVITLRFRCNEKVSVEKTLLKLVENYERSSGVTSTHAENGEIILRVMYRNNRRDEFFVVKGPANKKGDKEKLNRALTQFKKCIRFIYLKSGESLNDFLSGAFKELLHTVLQEHLASHVSRANRRRKQYVDELIGDLLTPLGSFAHAQLSDVMEEIKSVTVEPYVPALDETISRANIRVKDTAETTILNKGTGVRGALLVALLGYLAKHSRRSLLLAVEEPESFLHPQAQEELRDDINSLAKRSDVTLLVTTHSPFMLDRSAKTTITSLTKTSDGITQIGNQISGNDSHVPVVSGLFGETITPTVLEMVQPLLKQESAVLFVEGFTDKFYLETTARTAEREDLLEGLSIRSDEGANKSAVQAILLRQMCGQEAPIAALFDFDEHGRSAGKLLKSKFGWRGGHVMNYRKWRMCDSTTVPVEAEDMFPESFIETFVNSHPHLMSEKVRYNDGTFHYGITQSGKGEFMNYVTERLRPDDCTLWLEILKHVRSQLLLPVIDPAN